MKKKIVPFNDAEERVIKKLVDERARVENRFPLVFSLLITFGLVSTLYGFEKIIDQIDWLVQNPWVLLITGIVTLIITGAAYKKLN